MFARDERRRWRGRSSKAPGCTATTTVTGLLQSGAERYPSVANSSTVSCCLLATLTAHALVVGRRGGGGSLQIGGQVNDGCLAADAAIRSHPDMTHALSLLVAQHGEIVFERYYRDCAHDDLHPVHSVTKSFTSTLVGILVGNGLLSLDTPVTSLLAAPAFSADEAKRAITVRHLLTMSSGLDGGLLDGDDFWDIDTIASRGEPLVEGALQAPLVAAPGTTFSYNNGAAHVLSAVIKAAGGKPLDELAGERLFGPLKIDDWLRPTDPQGRHWGCGYLQLSARDLLKLGLLYLGGGTLDGARVLDEEYVRTATSTLIYGGRPERCQYGLLWWVADQATPPVYFAAGHGGQYVLVVPEHDLVIVITTDAEAVASPKGQPLLWLAIETIVPAFCTSHGQAARDNKHAT